MPHKDSEDSDMSKTVTLRLKEDVYAKFWTHAKGDNRSLSNFIETSALRYINEHEFVDEYEMAEIKSNTSLQASLKRAHKDAKARKGRIVK
jgi:hypothetical protein